MPLASYEELLFAAKNVLAALEDVGVTWCCLVGGMAVKLLGVDHVVHDLDFLIFSPKHNELALQKALRRLQPRNFSFKNPRRQNATFKLLKYRIPGTNHKIKIDLLHSTEPKVEIPRSLHPAHFVYVNELPVAPLYFVLYHKLLGWGINLHAREPHKRYQKVLVDYADIINLCSMAKRQGIRPLSKAHMGGLYLRNFRQRAEKFANWYGSEAQNAFRQIGFRV